jgi:acyl-coenzyme A thioesterase PaaI-like protein
MVALFEGHPYREGTYWMILAQLTGRKVMASTNVNQSMTKSNQDRRPVAFQDEMAFNHCFGCGPANDRGLQIKSYWQGEEAVATFRPQPHHAAGPEQYINGGILATVVDCHSINTAIAGAYGREGRAVGSLPIIWYVTASLKIDFLRPTPIDTPILLRASVKTFSERKSIVACTASSLDQICVRAELVAVRVPGSWHQMSRKSQVFP